ncbi:MAG: L-glutamate gamma-semialdehyde dehydrogenase, partial [Myxococcales bacterium]|nr:L-glutamate gamma-semialdehyde dehydrogenase [Myxococcales bacterium]
EEVQSQLGQEYSLVIGGKAYDTRATIGSMNPSNKKQLIGRVASARAEQAAQAIEIARRAANDWSRTDPAERIQFIETVATELRGRRYELAAWEVFECGKPWAEADADVAEAIDFCEYYGREMLRLAVPQRMQRVPGELNHLSYQGRGVAAVIAPWNFPLAILTGMTTAALVAGNPVIVKPAEQSMGIAARFFSLAREAGTPPGALHFLPGLGEEVGAHLVAHRDVATIAFTGSKAVGLAIWRQAGTTIPGQVGLKRVVCEMGGKNAIIVDSDADLDAAVLGIVRSAFGFAGQKCSACSRVVVLPEQHDALIERLAAAMESLHVMPPTDPGCFVGPVIDAEAHRRLLGALAEARRRGHQAKVGGAPLEGAGFFVPPTLFVDVPADDPLVTDELFGPVLAVQRADDFEHALTLATGVEYALTGGLYSRSPARIARAREAFRVGNLYINRGITGAIVGRQPFGGFAMSGGGTKAGGPDYLLHFLDPRTITENTLRRGFAPEE